MTKEDLNKSLKEARLKFWKEVTALKRAYIIANNKVKVGDIIRDHRCRLKVTEIKFQVHVNEPQAVYFGYHLRKDLKPYKTLKEDRIMQSYMLEIIK